MSPRAAGAAAAPDGRPSLAALGAPLQPQVDLLPPEVRSVRALGRAKVRLGFSLVVVVLLAVLAFVYVSFTEKQANDELATVTARVQGLEAEQAQYAEVPQVKNQVEMVKTARVFGTSTEVMWSDYLRAIEAVAPAGWTIGALGTTMPSPVEAPVLAMNPLAAASVGSLSFTARATTVPDIAAWADALETVPGFADAYFSAAGITEEDGVTFYDITATVQVNDRAYALRFLAGEES